MANVGKPINNTSGFKGVCFNKNRGKWQAQCQVNQRSYYLGLFLTPEEASAAYKSFAKEHQGIFYKQYLC